MISISARPREAIDKIDESMIQDPERVLRPMFNDKSMEVVEELSTSINYVKGECGHNYTSEIKPTMYELPHSQIILSIHAIPVISTILRKCLRINSQEETVIICSNLQQIQLVECALKRLGKNFITKTTLTGKSSNQNKSHIIDALDEPGKILITDYRLLRGLEVVHSIVFIDKEEENAAGLLVETFTRTITQLDMIVLPKSRKQKGISVLERTFKSYEKERLVRRIGVKVVQRGERRINITLTEHGLNNEINEILSDEDSEYEKVIATVGLEDKDISNTFR